MIRRRGDTPIDPPLVTETRPSDINPTTPVVSSIDTSKESNAMSQVSEAVPVPLVVPLSTVAPTLISEQMSNIIDPVLPIENSEPLSDSGSQDNN